MKKTSFSFQHFIAATTYLLSGTIIFNPIFSSNNFPLSLLCAFIIGFLLSYATTLIFKKQRGEEINNRYIYGILSVITSILSVFCALLLLTEVIKSVAFIADKPVSLLYYGMLAAVLIAVSFYLCYNSEKGIYRFCILTAFPFAVILFGLFSVFLTTRSFIPISISNSNISDAILNGLFCGLFIFSDLCVFHFCFKKFSYKDSGSIYKSSIVLSFFTVFIFFGATSIVMLLTFGGDLLSSLSDPYYSTVKLVFGIDITEILSSARIVAFIIKTSTYLYSAAGTLRRTFLPKRKAVIPFVCVLFLAIPVSFITAAFADKRLEYGAFQYLIYPAVILLSFLFALSYLLHTKKE